GGRGRELVYDCIFAEEVEYHGLLTAEGTITHLPHALLAFGSPEHKRRLLPAICRGELRLFLGYSEPEAGSDLAALQTRAERHGEGFRISGNKLYASDAHLADYGWVAARTGQGTSRHHDISLFLVDMKSPGVSVTSHQTIAGWNHPEVFFEDVYVPTDALIGEMGGAWRHVMYALDYERLFLASPGSVARSLHRLLDCCRKGPRPRMADPVVAHRLAELSVEVEGTRLLYYWAASGCARGEHPLPQASLALLVKRETARRIDRAMVEILGQYAQLRPGSPWAPAGGEAEHEYRENLYFQFAAGGFDITRHVVAARGLGLPRTP
ncbi:MAG: acyl-CoA dehydrogenase family protein, partial [Dehalococcoidia bacterium]|nr:acyl-CoA dehydrogenase family protein [Dehalococcoidia bacterium]